jgi:hypothetical protein
MSQETVDQIRRSYETFNRRDWAAFRRMMDPEIVVESRLVAMDGGYRGYEGLRRWWDQVFETMPDYKVEIETCARSATSSWSAPAASDTGPAVGHPSTTRSGTRSN